MFVEQLLFGWKDVNIFVVVVVFCARIPMLLFRSNTMAPWEEKKEEMEAGGKGTIRPNRNSIVDGGVNP